MVKGQLRHVIGGLWAPRTITQFLSVGIAGAMLETVLVALLTVSATAPPLSAKAVGAECSITLMFLLNDRITFTAQGTNAISSVLVRWGRSHIVRIGGLVVAFAVLWFLTARTAISLRLFGADLWPTVANLIGITGALGFNYVGESVFTWKVTRTEHPSREEGLSKSND